MEKSIEENIFETREIMKEVIGRSELSPSVLEMILHELYLEVRDLSRALLQRRIAEHKETEDTES